MTTQYCPLFREKAGRAKSFLRNSVSLVAVARITLSATIPKTARAVVCKQAYTTALSIFTILADSGYSRKKSKPEFCSPLNLCTILSSERSSRCASQKKPLWDSSKTYSPKGFTFRDVQLMPYFHNKSVLSSERGSRCAS